MRSYFPLFLLSLCVCIVSAHGDSNASSHESENVIVLTDDNFDEKTQTGTWLLDFYAPWCQHCMSLEPVLEAAAAELADTMYVGKIDCTMQKNLQRRFGIKSFPSIKFFRNGQDRTYKGPRTKDAFVAYGHSVTGPPVELLPHTHLPTLYRKSSVSFVFISDGTVSPAFSNAIRVFEKVAKQKQGMTTFASPFGTVHADTHADQLESESSISDSSFGKGIALSKILAEKLSVTAEAALPPGDSSLVTSAPVKRSSSFSECVLWVSEGSDTAVFRGPWNEASLGEWVNARMLPLIPELTGSNFDDVTALGKIIVFILTEPSVHAQKEFIASFLPLAKEYKEFSFVSLDAVEYFHYLRHFSISAFLIPTIFAFDFKNDLYYLDDTVKSMHLPRVTAVSPVSSMSVAHLLTAAPLPPEYLSRRPLDPASLTGDNVRGLYTREEHILFLEGIRDGSYKPRSMFAWYSPAKYQRMLEKTLGYFTEEQLMYIFMTFTFIIGGFMIWFVCCTGHDEKTTKQLQQLRAYREEEERKEKAAAEKAKELKAKNVKEEKNKSE